MASGVKVMGKYKFEIQSHIIVAVEADNVTEARMDIIGNLYRYVDPDPYVSDGEECNRGERNV